MVFGEFKDGNDKRFWINLECIISIEQWDSVSALIRTIKNSYYAQGDAENIVDEILAAVSEEETDEY